MKCDPDELLLKLLNRLGIGFESASQVGQIPIVDEYVYKCRLPELFSLRELKFLSFIYIKGCSKSKDSASHEIYKLHSETAD